MAGRIHGAVVAGVAFATLVWWVGDHPLGAALAAAGVAIYAVAASVHRCAWLVLLPAIWPVADLARWTGRIHVTESDALLLTTLVVAGVRQSIRPGRGLAESPAAARAGLSLWVSALFLLITGLVSLARGMDGFPPEGVEAWTGYSGAMNAVRVAKGLLLPLLLVPILHDCLRTDANRARAALALGLSLGLATASLLALSERIAFTSLSDFATDYRTTAGFWEMHVGGAALDGWIALTFPFAAWLALRWRHSLAGVVLMTPILGLGGYALLTTFSRGLYLAAAGGAAAMLVLGFASRRHSAARASPRSVALVLAGIAGLAAVAFFAFAHGGYRGATALLLSACLAYAAAPVAATAGRATAFAAAIAGSAAGVGIAIGATSIAKGPYLAFALTWLLAAACAAAALRRPGRVAAGLSTALYFAALATAAAVGPHWGGEGAVHGSLAAAGIAGAGVLLPALFPWPAWRPRLEGAFFAIIAAAGCALLAAVTSSFYFQARASTVSEDLSGRLLHWRHSISLVQDAEDAVLGIGAGRFPEAYFWNVPDAHYPGTWRIRDDGPPQGSFLRLGVPRHMLGFGDLLRVSQTIDRDAQAPFSYRLRARASGTTTLRIEICSKHLLYTWDCVIRPIELQASEQWQSFEGVTEAFRFDPGRWYAPRPLVLSVDLDGGANADVDDLEVVDAWGRDLVRNGSFSHGPDFWFFTSDRQHLPWHAKNLIVHLYVENGALGALMVLTVFAVALLRLVVAARAGEPLAAPVAAALVGFLLVGLFDSLLDVPRVTVWAVLLLMVGLMVPHHPLPGRPKANG